MSAIQKSPSDFERLSGQFLKKNPHLHKAATVCMTNQAELAIEIVRTGDAGVEFLRKNLNPSNDCRYAATLRALAWVSKKSRHLPWVKRTLLGALGSGSSAAEALHSLRLLRIRSAEKRARQWLRSGNPYAAAAALMYICKLYPKLRDEFLGAALRSGHYLVRGAAIDEIDEAGLVKYLPELRLLRKDRARDVREAARTAIANLTTLTTALRLRNGAKEMISSSSNINK